MGLAPGCEREPTPRPNVLVYVVDTLRADALRGPAVGGAKTPHFDALAEEGVTFLNAYANASWTRASMATLLTGLQPWHHTAETRSDRLPEAARTLTELFAEQGYSTALITANPNVSTVFGFHQAFERTSELYARSTPGMVGGRELVAPSDVVTNEIVAWLRGAEAPFFVVALPIDPHYPYRPPRRHDPGEYRGARGDGGDEALSRERSKELYRGEVAFNDESFGALVSVLRQMGHWDDTIVVVTSDHGEELWEYGARGHGKSLSEEVLRVPLIIRKHDDRRLPPGLRTEESISLVDLAPTLLDLAGLAIPDGLDGRSFFAHGFGDRPPVLAGLKLDGRNWMAAIEGDYKLVWDRDTDARDLYHLQGESPEAKPLDPGSSRAATAAHERLSKALESGVKPDRSLSRSAVQVLPKDVEKSLRALGYVE